MSQELQFGRNTGIVLLEIAKGLAAIQKDSALEEKIKSLHALNDLEKQRYKEAQEFMASADALKADIERQKLALVNIEDRLSEAKKAETANTEALKLISERERDVKAKLSEIEKGNNTLQIMGAALDERKLALDARQEQLEERETKVKEKEEKLRLAAEQSKAALSGI